MRKSCVVKAKLLSSIPAFAIILAIVAGSSSSRHTSIGSAALSAASADVVLYASDATLVAGAWSVVADAGAAGGSRLANPDVGVAKLAAALAAPASYFEMTFT